jgi:hypothetical protein
VEVLGIKVSPALLRNWVDWLAPERQPFYLTAKQVKAWSLTADDADPDREQRDTFRTYAVDGRLRSVWLDEATFISLPKATRRRRAGPARRRHARLGLGHPQAVPIVEHTAQDPHGRGGPPLQSHPWLAPRTP